MTRQSISEETRASKAAADARWEAEAEYAESSYLAKCVMLLEEVRETISDFIDVKDGPEGRPLPNWAMSLTQEIDDLIGKD